MRYELLLLLLLILLLLLLLLTERYLKCRSMVVTKVKQDALVSALIFHIWQYMSLV